MDSVGISGSNGGIQYETLQNINHADEDTETMAKTSPCSTAQRLFFASNDLVISRARTATFIGKQIGPQFRPLPAHIPPEISAFKLVANFSDYNTGHYTIGWRVKATKDFCIPNGLHFVVNVSYDAEPDISGSLDVIMPADKLNILVKEHWYNLILEEKLVIQPHRGKSHVQVVLCNNENIYREDFFGLVVEHVEIWPIALPRENQGISNIIVQRAGIPNFSIDTAKLTPSERGSSTSPSSAPVTRLASAKGSCFLASLALSKNTAYITVWDMSTVKNLNNSHKSAKQLYDGCATAVVEHAGVGDLPIGLSISPNGDQVAIFQEPKIGDWAEGSEVEKAAFPFRLFVNPLVPQSSFVLDFNTSSDNNASGKAAAPVGSSSVNDPATPTVQLTEVRWSHGLFRAFIGFSQFLPDIRESNSALNSKADDEGEGDDAKVSSSKGSAFQVNSMFVACNGLYLDVFEISLEKRWKRVNTITLTNLLPTLSRRITCKMMMESISSGSFMWLEDGGRSCTIWNLLTASNITRITNIQNAAFQGPTFHSHSKMAISPHESIIALTNVDGSLTTYFANTGMAIDDINFPGYKIEYVGFHSQDDQLFVILRNSTTSELTAKILDTLQLKSQTIANQVPIPSIGQTVLAFFYPKSFWNRGIICEPDATKINFYISHQPANSKVAKGNPNVVKASPEDVIYESRHRENIQYRLITGIHRELLPGGDGVSYWVLRVEVVEEDLEKRSQRVIFSFVPEPWMRVSTSEVSHPESLQSTYFVPCGTRFAVVGVQTLQIWNLPTRDNPKCSLQFFWSQPRDEDSFEAGDIEFKSERVRDYYMEIQGISIFMDTETGNTTAEIKMNDKARKLMIPLPGVGTIGARLAILHCFRSVHLLAAAFAFSQRESAKLTRGGAQVTFTYEEHCDAIVHFTREHINRMMSIGVYSPKKRRLPRATSLQANAPKLRKDTDDEPADLDITKSADLDAIKPVTSTIEEARKPTIIGANITIHANVNRHDYDDHDQDDRIQPVPKPVKHKRTLHRHSSNPKPRNAEVVTILTLLLDHPYLQHANHVFVQSLLNTENGDWIPRDNKTLNPIKHAIEARNGQLVMAFIEYCIKNAKKYHPSYLMPAVQCLKELSDHYPSMLTDIFKKASYVQTRNSGIAISGNIHGYIKPLKPVFSLQYQLPAQALNTLSVFPVKTRIQGRRNDRFSSRTLIPSHYDIQSRDLSHRFFVASFDLIWSYKVRYSPRSSGPYNSISWIRALFYLIMYKFFKKGEMVVECHDFTLEMLDSPAISALVEYKWNTIGRKYWMTRFFFQCCYYLLVLSVILLQVYGNYNRSLYHVFIGIIVWSCIFLWLEFLQCMNGWKRYFSSVYNIVDLAAFGLPLAGSINQLLIHSNKFSGDTSQEGNAALFSFSVLFMALQFLFELRVNRNICQFVTIIISVFGKIRMFFVIMTGNIIVFSIAILHMLRSCQFEACIPPTTDFQSHFYKAVSSTFFIIGGRYDPITDDLNSDYWAFHTLIIIFFSFTVILLLNVLIALINVAFNDSDTTWRLAWLENRMRFLESAENLSYHIPDFRRAYDFFPNEIYYSASEREVEEYEARYQISSESSLSLENKFMVETVTEGQNITQAAQRALMRDVQTLTMELKGMKQTQDGFNADLRKLIEVTAALVAQQHQDMYQNHSQAQSGVHEHPQRTQSDIVMPTVPHENIPLHVHPPQTSPQDPPENEDRV